MRKTKTWQATVYGPRRALGVWFLSILVCLLLGFSLCYLLVGDKPWTDREEMAALVKQGNKLPLQHHIAAGLFYASLVNLGLGAVVLLLRRWWARRLRELPAPPAQKGRMPIWVFLSGVSVAVLLAAALRTNLAKSSLWWDELWNIKHTMSGVFRPDMRDGGALKFREVGWDSTLYYYRKPTNHPPVAIASRLSLGAWREITGAGREEFDEVATRLPSLLAGLASVAGVAVLLRSWGFGAGGLVAALLLALHPWHVRYGVDARAYSFAVLWTVLGCLWLGKLVRAGGDAWRYWLLFGLNQLMLVWSLPNGIYYALAFGLVGLAYCLQRPFGSRLVPCVRLVAVNITAAMVFLLLFLPNALQIAEWGEVNDDHYLSTPVLRDAVTQLAFGMEHQRRSVGEAEGLTSFAEEMLAHPGLGWTSMILGVMALLIGLRVLWINAPRRSWLLLGLMFGAGLSLLVTWFLHQHFYHRYVVAYLIAPLVAVLGIGAVELGRMLMVRGRPAWLPLLSALLVVGSFAAFTREQRIVLSSRSYAPFREVAEYLGREARLQPIQVIGYGLGGRVFQVYFPEARFADTLAELDSELVRAEQGGGPVFIVCGYRQLNLEDPLSAGGAAKVFDPSLFAEVAGFGGIEPMFYFSVLRRKSG